MREREKRKRKKKRGKEREEEKEREEKGRKRGGERKKRRKKKKKRRRKTEKRLFKARPRVLGRRRRAPQWRGSGHKSASESCAAAETKTFVPAGALGGEQRAPARF